MPAWDPCPHLIKMTLLRAGRILYPEEKNVNESIKRIYALIGMDPIPTDSRSSPQGVGAYPLPNRTCPKCGRVTFKMFSINTFSAESEGGKYKTKFICQDDVCGHEQRYEQDPSTILAERMK